LIVNWLKAVLPKNEAKGFDKVKNVNGRKRDIGVDTLGLIMCVCVTAANIQDRDGLKMLCYKIKGSYLRLRFILADYAYQGVQNFVFLYMRCLLQILKGRDQKKGFVVIPKRGIV
jgi:hypothetical protein